MTTGWRMMAPWEPRPNEAFDNISVYADNWTMPGPLRVSFRGQEEVIVPPHIAFRISVPFGLIAWGVVTATYIWPALGGLSAADALRPLLILHSFRYLGLAFLV